MKNSKPLLFFLTGIILSLVVTTTMRFITLKDNTVHYHANFEVFINGKQFNFNLSKYQEEESGPCVLDESNNPIEKAHLHEGKGTVVHVHDKKVTWNNFFNNIRFNIGDTYLIDDQGNIYSNNKDNKVTFILNGKVIDSIYNRVIGDQDILLINYGNESKEIIMHRASQIPNDAKTFDESTDPSTCSSGVQLSFWDKLKEALIN